MASPNRLVQHDADRIIYGLGPRYVAKADGSTLALARDGGKSVRAEVTSAGAVGGAFGYRAYGQLVLSSSSSPVLLAYASQLFDSSGLLYMRARWYDPIAARFMSRDPLRGDAETPSTLSYHLKVWK